MLKNTLVKNECIHFLEVTKYAYIVRQVQSILFLIPTITSLFFLWSMTELRKRFNCEVSVFVSLSSDFNYHLLTCVKNNYKHYYGM